MDKKLILLLALVTLLVFKVALKTGVVALAVSWLEEARLSILLAAGYVLPSAVKSIDVVSASKSNVWQLPRDVWKDTILVPATEVKDRACPRLKVSVFAGETVKVKLTLAEDVPALYVKVFEVNEKYEVSSPKTIVLHPSGTTATFTVTVPKFGPGSLPMPKGESLYPSSVYIFVFTDKTAADKFNDPHVWTGYHARIELLVRAWTVKFTVVKEGKVEWRSASEAKTLWQQHPPEKQLEQLGWRVEDRVYDVVLVELGKTLREEGAKHLDNYGRPRDNFFFICHLAVTDWADAVGGISALDWEDNPFDATKVLLVQAWGLKRSVSAKLPPSTKHSYKFFPVEGLPITVPDKELKYTIRLYGSGVGERGLIHVDKDPRTGEWEIWTPVVEYRLVVVVGDGTEWIPVPKVKVKVYVDGKLASEGSTDSYGVYKFKVDWRNYVKDPVNWAKGLEKHEVKVKVEGSTVKISTSPNNPAGTEGVSLKVPSMEKNYTIKAILVSPPPPEEEEEPTTPPTEEKENEHIESENEYEAWTSEGEKETINEKESQQATQSGWEVVEEEVQEEKKNPVVKAAESAVSAVTGALGTATRLVSEALRRIWEAIWWVLS